MRVIVNDIAASTGGALTILRDFYNFIKNNKQASEHEWIFLLSDIYIEETENIKTIILKENKKWKNKIIFDFITGKKYINKLEPDILISFQNTYTYGLNCPQIIYMHQAIPFQEVKKFSFFKVSEFKLAIYQFIIGFIIKKAVRASDHVIVQTEWIKKSIIKICNLDPDNISIIKPNIQNFDLPTEETFSERCFFYPADNLLYKNHKVIKAAVEILNNKKVHNFSVLLTTPEININSSNIVSSSKMDFNEVLKNYACSTLIFPSYIETLGLPLLEAKKMGTIILASDTPFAREALDGYNNSYYFGIDDAKMLSHLMEKIINKDIVKKEQNENLKTEYKSWSKIFDIIDRNIQ